MFSVRDFFQTMSRKNSDPNGANPMLYDPLQDGIGETSKMRQFLAATIGKTLRERKEL